MTFEERHPTHITTYSYEGIIRAFEMIDSEHEIKKRNRDIEKMKKGIVEIDFTQPEEIMVTVPLKMIQDFLYYFYTDTKKFTTPIKEEE